MGAAKILSIWSGPDLTHAFLGSGCQLDGRHVLTAKHLVRDREKAYVGLVDDHHGLVAATVINCHQDHDAAILQLDAECPINGPPPWLMNEHISLNNQVVTMHAIDPLHHGVHRADYQIGSYDAGRAEYVLTPDNARGHSGGVITWKNQVVGLLFARMKGEPLCRAVSMHRLLPWLLSHAPTLSAFSSDVTGAPYAETRDAIRVILLREEMLALSRTWGTDPLQGLTTHDVTRVVNRMRAAIELASSEGLTFDGRSMRRFKDGCRDILARVYRLAIDGESARTWINKQLTLPCQSAEASAFIHAVASSAGVKISPSPMRSNFRVERMVDDAGLDAGVGKDRVAQVQKEFWCQVFIEAFPSGEQPLHASLHKELVDAMTNLSEGDDRPFVLTGVDTTGGAGLRRLAQTLPVVAVARSGIAGDILLVDEGKLNSALALCLRAIEECA
ncbi:hypothetical protein [Roseateles sp.]|uniref:hypothetical protein n=1 Tax=Roseateles sp. TaxID=1971397 RepID=UPI003D137F05